MALGEDHETPKRKPDEQNFRVPPKKRKYGQCSGILPTVTNEGQDISNSNHEQEGSSNEQLDSNNSALNVNAGVESDKGTKTQISSDNIPNPVKAGDQNISLSTTNRKNGHCGDVLQKDANEGIGMSKSNHEQQKSSKKKHGSNNSILNLNESLKNQKGTTRKPSENKTKFPNPVNVDEQSSKSTPETRKITLRSDASQTAINKGFNLTDRDHAKGKRSYLNLESKKSVVVNGKEGLQTEKAPTRTTQTSSNNKSVFQNRGKAVQQKIEIKPRTEKSGSCSAATNQKLNLSCRDRGRGKTSHQDLASSISMVNVKEGLKTEKATSKIASNNKSKFPHPWKADEQDNELPPRRNFGHVSQTVTREKLKLCNTDQGKGKSLTRNLKEGLKPEKATSQISSDNKPELPNPGKAVQQNNEWPSKKIGPCSDVSHRATRGQNLSNKNHGETKSSKQNLQSNKSVVKVKERLETEKATTRISSHNKSEFQNQGKADQKIGLIKDTTTDVSAGPSKCHINGARHMENKMAENHLKRAFTKQRSCTCSHKFTFKWSVTKKRSCSFPHEKN